MGPKYYGSRWQNQRSDAQFGRVYIDAEVELHHCASLGNVGNASGMFMFIRVDDDDFDVPYRYACHAKDRDLLPAFYGFPAKHWKHIRTTNPIESTFATVRLRPPKPRATSAT